MDSGVGLGRGTGVPGRREMFASYTVVRRHGGSKL